MRPFSIVNIVFVASLVVIDLAYFAGVVEWWWILIIVLVYLHILVLGAIYIRWNFFLKSYNKGSKSNLIALTFDDGPSTETARILDVLMRQNVQAAFFSIGKNAVNHPELVKRWHNEGHLIGNHSYNHGFNFDWQSSKTMANEITQTNETIKKITGVIPKLFRPPYGVTNPNVAKAVSRTSMYSIGWNIRSFDTKAKDKDALLEKILSRLKGGDIILLHDSMAITAEILTELIVNARQKGFNFARVDQLLDLEAYA
ncbi:MAG: polysaccharide deacetylase family protein [Bacteroidetes bacterium]|nr:polysaccharide deacetylase family protein [Bacteroidota bacterium]